MRSRGTGRSTRPRARPPASLPPGSPPGCTARPIRMRAETAERDYSRRPDPMRRRAERAANAGCPVFGGLAAPLTEAGADCRLGLSILRLAREIGIGNPATLI